jgi:tRNA threonylcarbamoyladenosine biosynthesis protein TsaE
VRNVVEIHSTSPGQTRAVGRALGEILRGGEVVELCGPLGAGKTQLAKGLARGLGVPPDEPIVSPSFVLVREYAGRLTFYHCDAYRLHTIEELLALGLDEMLDQRDAVVAIEWADRFPQTLAADIFRVDLDYQDDDAARSIRVTAPSAASATEFARHLEASGRETRGR